LGILGGDYDEPLFVQKISSEPWEGDEDLSCGSREGEEEEGVRMKQIEKMFEQIDCQFNDDPVIVDGAKGLLNAGLTPGYVSITFFRQVPSIIFRHPYFTLHRRKLTEIRKFPGSPPIFGVQAPYPLKFLGPRLKFSKFFGFWRISPPNLKNFLKSCKMPAHFPSLTFFGKLAEFFFTNFAVVARGVLWILEKRSGVRDNLFVLNTTFCSLPDSPR
jgi:hypothetical protein